LTVFTEAPTNELTDTRTPQEAGIIYFAYYEFEENVDKFCFTAVFEALGRLFTFQNQRTIIGLAVR